jgi:hypothetical protein
MELWNKIKIQNEVLIHNTTAGHIISIICPWSETVWKWRPDVLLVGVMGGRRQAGR